jgi:hypothetical protein
MQCQPQARAYRATLIPDTVNYDEVEFQADHGLLPTIQLQARDASTAMADAHRVSGKPVLRVERVRP